MNDADFWNSRYGEAGFAFGVAPNTFLQESIHRFLPGGRLLCLAEGEGRNAVFLARQGFIVTATDISAVGMRKTEEMARQNGVFVETVVADLQDFEIVPEQWDGIISIFCHLPSSLRASLYARAVRGLKPGGVFLLEAYAPEQTSRTTGGPRTRELLASVQTLREELAGLSFPHAMQTERAVVEGTYHTGDADVVQIVAVKP